MTATAADPMAALGEYFKTTPVNAVTAGRIFRPELDEDEIRNMPRAAVVIRRAGGYGMFGGSQVPIGDPRLDIVCYGQTYLQAEQTVAGEVVNALKALRGGVFGLGPGSMTRLYWARVEGGPNPMTDPEENWPMALVTAQVAHCELAVG